jgi:hypothetical protein
MIIYESENQCNLQQFSVRTVLVCTIAAVGKTIVDYFKHYLHVTASAQVTVPLDLTTIAPDNITITDLNATTDSLLVTTPDLTLTTDSLQFDNTTASLNGTDGLNTTDGVNATTIPGNVTLPGATSTLADECQQLLCQKMNEACAVVDGAHKPRCIKPNLCVHTCRLVDLGDLLNPLGNGLPVDDEVSSPLS